MSEPLAGVVPDHPDDHPPAHVDGHVDGHGDAHALEERPHARWRPRVAGLSIAVAAAVLAIDQLTKHWAVNALADGRPRHVVWTLQWNLAFNSGMAFSSGRGLGPIIGVLALVVVVVFVIGSGRVESPLARVAVGMLIGGAAGNITDRLLRGEGWLRGSVVDFIDFQWFPIFNVADIGVDVGAALFVLASVLAGRREDRHAAAATSSTGGAGASDPG